MRRFRCRLKPCGQLLESLFAVRGSAHLIVAAYQSLRETRAPFAFEFNGHQEDHPTGRGWKAEIDKQANSYSECGVTGRFVDTDSIPWRIRVQTRHALLQSLNEAGVVDDELGILTIFAAEHNLTGTQGAGNDQKDVKRPGI